MVRLVVWCCNTQNGEAGVPGTLAEYAGENSLPAVSAAANGNVAIVWQEQDGERWHIRLRCRRGETGAWSEPHQVETTILGIPHPQVAAIRVVT